MDSPLKETKAKKEYTSDLILVLDLDETLWWTPRTYEEYKEFHRQHGLEDHQVGAEQGLLLVEGFGTCSPLRLRPGALDFLKTAVMSKKYETHIFTRAKRNGLAPYAIDAVAKAVVESGGDKSVDPANLFAGRHYDDECEDVYGFGFWFCKPLKPLVRASRGDSLAEDALLKRVVIVDDRSDSYYSCNKHNGIPVRAFHAIRDKNSTGCGKDEVEYVEDGSGTFERLAELLEKLETAEDVRPILKEMFDDDSKRKYL